MREVGGVLDDFATLMRLWGEGKEGAGEEGQGIDSRSCGGWISREMGNVMRFGVFR